MSKNNLEQGQSLEQNQNINNQNNLEQEQNSFLNSMIGKAINSAIDIGIRAILPDLVEEQAIQLKDNLLNYGLKDGLKKSIDDVINAGKSVIGIVTGNFDNVSQMQMAVKQGGILDTTSNIIDVAVDKMNEKGILNSNIANLIKNGKEAILNNVESNIEKSFTVQLESMEKLNKSIDNWNSYYKNKDFDNMEKEFQKIENEKQNLVPIEQTLQKVKKIENIHEYIKNNGQDFNLSQDKLELLEKLS